MSSSADRCNLLINLSVQRSLLQKGTSEGPRLTMSEIPATGSKNREFILFLYEMILRVGFTETSCVIMWYKAVQPWALLVSKLFFPGFSEVPPVLLSLNKSSNTCLYPLARSVCVKPLSATHALEATREAHFGAPEIPPVPSFCRQSISREMLVYFVRPTVLYKAALNGIHLLVSTLASE